MSPKAVKEKEKEKEKAKDKDKEKDKESKAPARKEAKASKGKAVRTKEKEKKPVENPVNEAAPGQLVQEQTVDLEEFEDAEAERAATSQNSNAAALAAAGTAGEMSASFKNFRHHPDMENFYRFIYENDLRHEALAIIENVLVEKRNQRQAKAGSRH